ncbi:GNAT family N-acetyltransferase [Anaeromicrobium sediminis]|uniref:GNAT family N-acetyltransferase n=1 Tax=Anaeromicrobium sediminis TaxID=1478221 RepID=A0A267MND6_9FIRM|nr:GNAT family protein [Anaeromicrobium sediminis]PAB60343.1 GNAT family N-acetyltransferase [Anaeromicrobium sediminis]
MIRLEYLDKEDFRKIVQWNENKSSDYLFQWAGPMYKYPLTEIQIEDYFLNEVQRDKSNIFAYKITLVETNEFVGTIELHVIDEVNRIGRIRRFLIGEESLRGKGIGKLALENTLRIGFEKLNLQKITLGVFDFNHNAIRIYENAGFIKEKLLQNVRKASAPYWNLYEMAIAKVEWQIKND